MSLSLHDECMHAFLGHATTWWNFNSVNWTCGLRTHSSHAKLTTNATLIILPTATLYVGHVLEKQPVVPRRLKLVAPRLTLSRCIFYWRPSSKTLARFQYRSLVGEEEVSAQPSLCLWLSPSSLLWHRQALPNGHDRILVRLSWLAYW